MAVEFRCRAWLSDDAMESTRALLESREIVLVIADDLKHEVHQPDKCQAPLPAGAPREILPIPAEVTAPQHGVYIRIHRREGSQRVLTTDEFEGWGRRLQELRSKRLGGPILFLWGTRGGWA